MIMKKLIILMLALMAMSFIGASTISYYGGITSYIHMPWNYTPEPYSLVRIATVFEPSGECVVNSINMSLYQPEHLFGNVTATLRPVDAAGNIIETGLTAPSATVLSANLVFHTGQTTFTFSGTEAQRTIAAGEKFAVVLSCPNGTTDNTVLCAPLGSTESNGHSWIYWSDDGWALRTNLEWAMAADVTYAGPFIDIAAKSLYFTGDFFLQPGETIAYEADIISNSTIPITADVILKVYDQANPATPIWSHTIANQNFPVSTDSLHFIFPEYTYPAEEGEYQVVLSVYNANDMNADNNMTDLEQITFLPPGNMDYINDVLPAGNAFGWNADDEPEVGVDFWYYAAPLKLNTVGFRIWDNTWPAQVAGHEFLKYAIYNWVEGMPNLLYVTPTALPCTLGQWNDYDVPVALTFEPGESFMVTYKQYNLYPACPGLAVDDTAPVSGWATSYYWDPVDGWMLGYDDDFMIRAGVEEIIMGVEAPIVSIMLDGNYSLIAWDEVPGAESYNVYGTNDPENTTPWTPIETGIQDLGYQYDGTESFKFFYVTASTQEDGRKMALGTQMKTIMPTQLPARNSVNAEKTFKAESMITPAISK